MDREKLLRSLVAPFDADMQVKALVAGCYIRDGYDLLEVFRMGWESDRNNRSYRSKLFINLRMAIECYLKALVITYSDKAETPEDAYKVARKASHKLVDLRAEVQTRSGWNKRYFRRASDAFIAQVDGMQVGLRYEVDMAAEFSKEKFEETLLVSGPMTGTIGSDKWMLSLCEHAAYIGMKASKAFQYNLHDHTGTLGADANERSKRIKLFLSNLGLL
jgi:hypothetical protein